MVAAEDYGDGWVPTIRHFAAALTRPSTYAWHRNPYAIFGLLWGLPVPLATLSVECVASGAPIGPAGWIARLSESPWQWWFMFHPLLFAVIFGAFGTLAAERVDRIRQLLGELQVRADTDALTDLLNRRSFEQRLREEGARAERDARSISLLFCDIDHFKTVNDRHGHQAGDRVLTGIGACLRRTVRPYDVVARYGGEEFAIILPEASEAEAANTAERIRVAVEDTPFEISPGQYLRVTVSIGAAERQPEQSLSDLLRAADESMYDAKRSGRNAVRCATGNHPRPPALPPS